MDRNAQMLVGFKDLKERKVAVLIGLLKDAIEITDRLVIVQNERKSDPSTHQLFSCIEVCIVAGLPIDDLLLKHRSTGVFNRPTRSRRLLCLPIVDSSEDRVRPVPVLWD